MRSIFHIRPARIDEAPALSDLCFRSKAVWGYDTEFMALMPTALKVACEEIAAGDVWVATGADGQVSGVVALAPGDGPGTLDLNKLFIDPRNICKNRSKPAPDFGRKRQVISAESGT